MELPRHDVRQVNDSGQPTTEEYRARRVQAQKFSSLETTVATKAPNTASYLTISAETDLSAERRVVAGSGIAFTDGGANSTLTISVAAGAVLQALQNVYTTNADLTSTIPLDDTTPTSSEGTQVLSQAITPASSSNKVLVEAVIYGSVNTNSVAMIAALFRGTTCIQAAHHTFSTSNFPQTLKLSFLDSPNTTSATTYTVRVGPNSNTLRLNGTTTTRLFGGAASCTLTLMEIKG